MKSKPPQCHKCLSVVLSNLLCTNCDLAPYRGWFVSFNERRPITGKWMADRYGVSVCAVSKEILYKIIDNRIKKYPDNGD